MRLLKLTVLLALGLLALPLASTASAPPTVTLYNQLWHCRSPQHGTVVNVTVNSTSHLDAVHLDAGCTGSIVVHVRTNSADGIKVHKGVHDLQVTGDVSCTHKHGTVHQDGVQAMGGDRVTFGSRRTRASFIVDCPTGNNGGIWVNAGRNSGDDRANWPTDIVCDHCDLYERNAAVHIGPRSVRSGVRDSVLHEGHGGAAPRGCRRIDKAAIAPLDVATTCTAAAPRAVAAPRLPAGVDPASVATPAGRHHRHHRHR